MDPSWRWFEPELTYDNARLPQAMLLGAALLEDDAAAARAIAALDWYAQHVGLADGTLRCVGNRWHRRGEPPAVWLADDGDEQPLDAAAITEAMVDAWQHTADPTLGAAGRLGLLLVPRQEPGRRAALRRCDRRLS